MVSPPGELLQRLRHRTRRRRHRQPRYRAGPQWPSQPGAEDRRSHPAVPDRGRGREVPAASTERTIKMTVPGPLTMSQQAQNDHYPDAESAAMAYSEAVNAEVKDLFAAGRHRADRRAVHAGTPGRRPGLRAGRAERRARRRDRHDRGAYLFRVRGDHPWASGGLLVPARARRMPGRPDLHRDGAVGSGFGALADLTGKTLLLGVIDLSTPEVESPEPVAERYAGRSGGRGPINPSSPPTAN